MIKSVVKNLYDLLTTGPLKKAFQALTTKYPRFEPFVRHIQVQLFDWYLVKPRIVQFRANPTSNILFVDVSFLGLAF